MKLPSNAAILRDHSTKFESWRLLMFMKWWKGLQNYASIYIASSLGRFSRERDAKSTSKAHLRTRKTKCWLMVIFFLLNIAVISTTIILLCTKIA